MLSSVFGSNLWVKSSFTTHYPCGCVPVANSTVYILSSCLTCVSRCIVYCYNVCHGPLNCVHTLILSHLCLLYCLQLQLTQRCAFSIGSLPSAGRDSPKADINHFTTLILFNVRLCVCVAKHIALSLTSITSLTQKCVFLEEEHQAI